MVSIFNVRNLAQIASLLPDRIADDFAKKVRQITPTGVRRND